MEVVSSLLCHYDGVHLWKLQTDLPINENVDSSTRELKFTLHKIPVFSLTFLKAEGERFYLQLTVLTSVTTIEGGRIFGLVNNFFVVLYNFFV